MLTASIHVSFLATEPEKSELCRLRVIHLDVYFLIHHQDILVNLMERMATFLWPRSHENSIPHTCESLLIRDDFKIRGGKRA